MTSTPGAGSVFFFAYDEGGGPYDHVPRFQATPMTSPTHLRLAELSERCHNHLGQAGQLQPVRARRSPGEPALRLEGQPPGSNTGRRMIPRCTGFAAQLGFRIPNMVISPFAKKHYVSHIPMDHTAVIKFVENRFIGNARAWYSHLTRDAAQPSLLDFFDFTGVPWATPPTPPTPVTTASSLHTAIAEVTHLFS